MNSLLFLALLAVMMIFMIHHASASAMPTFEKEWKIRSNMLSARSDQSATTIGDKIYVAGGCASDQFADGNCANLTAAFEIYSPASDSWTKGPSMPTRRFRHCAVAVEKKLFIIGGRNHSDMILPSIDVFDTANNQWSTLNTTIPIGALTSDNGCFSFDKNGFYLVGGYSQNYTALPHTFYFNIASNTWTEKARFSTPRGDFGAVVVNNTKAIIVGGFTNGNFCEPLRSVEIYDKASNAWSAGVPLKYPRGDKAVGTFSQWIVIAGGETKNSACNASVPIHSGEFSDGVSPWSATPNIKDNRFRFPGASWNYTFFIFGGQDEHDPQEKQHKVLKSVESLSLVPENPISSANRLSYSLACLLVFLLSAVLF